MKKLSFKGNSEIDTTTVKVVLPNPEHSRLAFVKALEEIISLKFICTYVFKKGGARFDKYYSNFLENGYLSYEVNKDVWDRNQYRLVVLTEDHRGRKVETLLSDIKTDEVAGHIGICREVKQLIGTGTQPVDQVDVEEPCLEILAEVLRDLGYDYTDLGLVFDDDEEPESTESTATEPATPADTAVQTKDENLPGFEKARRMVVMPEEDLRDYFTNNLNTPEKRAAYAGYLQIFADQIATYIGRVGDLAAEFDRLDQIKRQSQSNTDDSKTSKGGNNGKSGKGKGQKKSRKDRQNSGKDGSGKVTIQRKTESEKLFPPSAIRSALDQLGVDENNIPDEFWADDDLDAFTREQINEILAIENVVNADGEQISF